MSSVDALLTRLLELERPLLLALDVDGTLAPIVHDPDIAEIPAETLSTLSDLAKTPRLEVALITGRDLRSLSRMEQLEGVWRAVEHGGLVLAPGQSPSERTLTPEQRGALDRFRRWADEHARDAYIEYKPQAIALHVRRIAANDPARAEKLLREAEALATTLCLHVRRGRALCEVEAVGHDKGSALREIFERCGAKSAFFAGDDLTDFGAIDFATEHGVGAFVRSEERRGAPSATAAILHSVEEVAVLLSQLLHRMT